MVEIALNQWSRGGTLERFVSLFFCKSWIIIFYNITYHSTGLGLDFLLLFYFRNFHIKRFVIFHIVTYICNLIYLSYCLRPVGRIVYRSFFLTGVVMVLLILIYLIGVVFAVMEVSMDKQVTITRGTRSVVMLSWGYLLWRKIKKVFFVRNM